MGALLLTSHDARRIRAVLEQRAVHLPDPFDGGSANIELLAPLDDDVRQAEFVALGELNHFVHEKSDFRLYLSRYLLSRGYRNFAEELGWSDGVRVDRYYRTGDDHELERLPSFGYSGHMRPDRDDRPSGVLKAPFDAYPVALFRAEQARYYRGFRTAGEHTRHFGFDIDALPGGTYEDIDDLLARHEVVPAVRQFRRALSPVKGETPQEEAARLRRTLGPLSEITSAVGEEHACAIAVGLTALADSLDYIAMTYSAATYEALRPGMAFREDAMKRRIEAIEGLCHGPLVLMGHALHLAKDDRPVWFRAGVGPGGGWTTSLGHHIAQTLGRRVLSVLFLYGGGEDSQPFKDLPRRASYPPDSLNALLAEFGIPLFFRTDAAAFDQSSKIGHMYNAIVEAPLRALADAVFFLPSVTPLREN